MNIWACNILILLIVANCVAPIYFPEHSGHWNLVRDVSNECLLKSYVDSDATLINAYLINDSSTNKLIEYYKLAKNKTTNKSSFIVEVYSNRNNKDKSFRKIESFIEPFDSFKYENTHIKSFSDIWVRINGKPKRLNENVLLNEQKMEDWPIKKRETNIIYYIYININLSNFLKNEPEIVKTFFYGSNTFDFTDDCLDEK